MPPKKKEDVAKKPELKIEIKNTDMPQEMQEQVIKSVKAAVETTRVEKDLAAIIKKEFDSLYPQTTWHVITGNHFGVSVTHATGYIMFLGVDNSFNILIYKSM